MLSHERAGTMLSVGLGRGAGDARHLAHEPQVHGVHEHVLQSPHFGQIVVSEADDEADGEPEVAAQPAA